MEGLEVYTLVIHPRLCEGTVSSRELLMARMAFAIINQLVEVGKYEEAAAIEQDAIAAELLVIKEKKEEQ